MRPISAASRMGRPAHAAGGASTFFHGLEGQHQAEQHRRGHVDPQDLQRRDRQRRAGEDGGNDDEAFTEVGGQRPGDELDEVVVNAAPSSTAASMLAKLSSVSTIAAASRATSVPGKPHRDADVGRPSVPARR